MSIIISNTETGSICAVYLKFSFGSIYCITAIVSVQLFGFVLQPLIEIVTLAIKSKEQDCVLEINVAFLIVNW